MFLSSGFRKPDREDNFRGASEKFIEVLLPSNTAAEIYDKEQICLANGAQEFWVADSDRCQVEGDYPGMGRQ
jgi:Uma2 family endonuclease